MVKNFRSLVSLMYYDEFGAIQGCFTRDPPLQSEPEQN